jgi:hypothetical protein
MKKIKIMTILAICMMFGVNAYAAAGRQGYNPPRQQVQKHNNYNQKNVRVVKYVPVKPKPQPKVVTKTVVVHHYEQPRHNPAAETVALVGLGIIATAAIAKAIF